jgi:hypothetical protein
MKSPEMEAIVKDLCASEINGSISWRLGIGIDVKLGEAHPGYKAQETCDTPRKAVEWLQAEAAHHYPQTPFADKSKRTTLRAFTNWATGLLERVMRRFSQPRLDFEDIAVALYASQISTSISWVCGAGIDVGLGDQQAAYKARNTVSTLTEAAEWLREEAVSHYPQSSFAHRYRGDKPSVPDLGDMQKRLATGLPPMLFGVATFSATAVNVIPNPAKTLIDEFLSILAAFCVFSASILIDYALDSERKNWKERISYLGYGYFLFCCVVGFVTAFIPALYDTKRNDNVFTFHVYYLLFGVTGLLVFIKMMSELKDRGNKYLTYAILAAFFADMGVLLYYSPKLPPPPVIPLISSPADYS